MGRFNELAKNAIYTLREDGANAVFSKVKTHARGLAASDDDPLDYYTDVLFINGCAYSVPHPVRYRVDHQVEQLNASGLTARKIDEWDLTPDWVRTARVFVIFRCPYNDRVGDFIALAKKLNKTVLYDIDDLVIDTVYTDQISHLDTMSEEERNLYDDGVRRMQKTMMLCDGVITTTQGMADELKKYLPVVYVNRNVASEEMLYLSQKAVRERDILPNITQEQLKKNEAKAWRNASEAQKNKDSEAVKIGYFSGSITHNEDFENILPALAQVMEAHPNVELHVVGELSIPDELKSYADRVVSSPFLPWERLPRLIAGVDINIAPLVDTVFNRAKSENKWLEASLVKVPTVASRVGALADSIKDGQTGCLCESLEDWTSVLNSLVEDRDKRLRIAKAAYEECVTSKTTVATGSGLARFIEGEAHESIAFVFPSFEISGGNLVSFKHARMLHGKGYDVTLIDHKGGKHWLEIEGVRFPVLNRLVAPREMDECPIVGRFNKMVGTFWETTEFVKRYPFADRKLYLVQNKEQNFYEAPDYHRPQATSTYCGNFEYITISRWCQNWLLEEYNQTARYAPNGIERAAFKPVERDYSGKIRILVEGDCSVEYKNVDESFRIIDQLDPDKYEVWYMSYKGNPKSFYRVDKFLHAVPHEEVAHIYQQCHILLKTSVLESFSYPPLEMMATGGVSVVLSNPGNAEYLVDQKNCLLFNEGQEEHAAQLIRSVVEDESLRSRIIEEGLKTAESRDWPNLEEEITTLYK